MSGTMTSTARFRVVRGEDLEDSVVDEVASALVAISPPDLEGELWVTALPGGASNHNYLLTSATGSRTVLRVAADLCYSERFGLDRWREAEAHRVAQRAGVALPLLGMTLPRGHSLVAFGEEPVVGVTRIREPGVLEACTQALRTAHLAGAVADSFCPYVEISRFFRIATDEGLAMPGDIRGLVAVSERISDLFAATDVPNRLCHNDVQLPNFLSGRHTWVLDWEYAGQGNPFFDLAMIASNAELTADELPRLLKAYFGELREVDIARLRLQQIQSSLREAMWSVIAEPVLDTGWDYQQWAGTYFDKVRAICDSGRLDGLILAAAPQPDDASFYARATTDEPQRPEPYE